MKLTQNFLLKKGLPSSKSVFVSQVESQETSPHLKKYIYLHLFNVTVIKIIEGIFGPWGYNLPLSKDGSFGLHSWGIVNNYI